MPLQMENLIWLGVGGAVLCLGFALLQLRRALGPKVEANDPLQGWYKAIREGERAFFKVQYPLLFGAFCLIFALFVALFSGGLLPDPFFPAAFFSGGVCGTLVCLIGTKVSDAAGIAAARAAGESFNRALGTVFSSGAVAGFLAAGLGLAHVTGWILFLKYQMGYTPDAIAGTMIPFGAGACLMALLLRLGGSFFSQAANLGSRMAEGTEETLGPAVARCVGGGAGCMGGLGAGLYESYVASLLAALALGAASAEDGLMWSALVLPLAVAAIGAFCSMIATLLIRSREKAGQRELLFILRKGCYTAAILTGAVCIPVTYLLFGSWELWFPVLTGLVAGCIFSYWTECSTSAAYGPVHQLSRAAETGTEGALLEGLRLGLRSTAGTVFIASASILIAFLSVGGTLSGDPSVFFKGCYAVALAGVGMLSTAGITLAAGSMGPGCRNASRLAEAQWPEDGAVTERSRALSFLGSSAMAGGKGFDAGASFLTAAAMLLACVVLLRSQLPSGTLQLTHPAALAGILLGVMTAFAFAALVIKGVQRSVQAGAEELRRQRRESRETSDRKPAQSGPTAFVGRCAKSALRQMAAPILLAALSPVAAGLILGVPGMLGLVFGVMISGFALSVYMSNTGSAWGNAMEYIESGKLGGKGSACHKAATVCAGVGDPFREVAGPALNQLMKLCAAMALLTTPLLLSFDFYAFLAAILG